MVSLHEQTHLYLVTALKINIKTTQQYWDYDGVIQLLLQRLSFIEHNSPYQYLAQGNTPMFSMLGASLVSCIPP